jgi:hypothetical protein
MMLVSAVISDPHYVIRIERKAPPPYSKTEVGGYGPAEIRNGGQQPVLMPSGDGRL